MGTIGIERVQKYNGRANDLGSTRAQAEGFYNTAAPPLPMTRTARFIAEANPPSPYLVIDLEVVSERYRRLRRALPRAGVYYAVKANPAPEVLRVLDGLGSSFDCASIYEIEHCMALGIPPERISFGSTIKKRADIEAAFRSGVNLFAFDSEGELAKLAAAAPGAQVFCRLLTSGEGADWTLSRKFGCDFGMARRLLLQAAAAGVQPYGLSFHVGSQQRDLSQWEPAVAQARRLFEDLGAAGLRLDLLNLGGGLPGRYRTPVEEIESYGAAISGAVERHFGPEPPRLIIEPGRAIVADAGVIVAEVILAATKSDRRRWVYLDVGKFGGLPETMDEAIQYRITTPRAGGPDGPVVLTGPTCDSADVLYEAADYRLPLALEAGDRVMIHGAGAYTTSYSAVAFNGFPPLRTYCVSEPGARGRRELEARRSAPRPRELTGSADAR